MQHYLITDPNYYTNNPAIFKERLEKVLHCNNVDIACFRDKTSSNFKELAQIFVKVCQEFKIQKILINEDLELAKTLNCGIHLTSQQFDKIQEAKKYNLYTIISCHTLEELQLAQQQKVNATTYSPIFETPNKGAPKGIKHLEEILQQIQIPIIALGGIIHHTQVAQIAQTKALGFASIRYFLNHD